MEKMFEFVKDELISLQNEMIDLFEVEIMDKKEKKALDDMVDRVKDRIMTKVLLKVVENNKRNAVSK